MYFTRYVIIKQSYRIG